MSGLKAKIKELEKIQEKIELVSSLKKEIEKLVDSFNPESKLLDKEDRKDVSTYFSKFCDGYSKLLEGAAIPEPQVVAEATQASIPQSNTVENHKKARQAASSPALSSFRKFVGLEAKANVNGTLIEGRVKNVTNNAIVFSSFGGETLLLKPEEFIPPTGR